MKPSTSASRSKSASRTLTFIGLRLPLSPAPTGRPFALDHDDGDEDDRQDCAVDKSAGHGRSRRSEVSQAAEDQGQIHEEYDPTLPANRQTPAPSVALGRKPKRRLVAHRSTLSL